MQIYFSLHARSNLTNQIVIFSDNIVKWQTAKNQNIADLCWSPDKGCQRFTYLSATDYTSVQIVDRKP
jgi:hypothetical protein